MEARRYRYYEVWANRVRAIEAGYFGPMLSHHCIPPDTEWAEHVSENLLRPTFPIGEWKALGMRLRANYAWIYVLLALSWGLKVYIHPSPATDFSEFVHRAHVGLVPGWVVIGAGILFNLVIFAITLATVERKIHSSEVEPDHEIDWQPLKQENDETWTEELNKQNDAR